MDFREKDAIGMASGYNDVLLSVVCIVLLFLLSTACFFAVLKSLGFYKILVASSALLGLAAALLFLIKMRAKNIKTPAIVISCAIIGASIFVANLVFDFSPDGIGYHQDAVLEMTKHFDLLRSSLGGKYPLYTNHYPKLAWYYTAALYALTDNIHIGKSINFILFAAVFLMAYAVFRRIPLLPRILASLALAGNPILISQLFSHYVDGVLGGFITISILGIYAFFWLERSKVVLIITILAIMGCAALKHTGFVFSFVIVSAIFYLLRKNSIKWSDYMQAPLFVSLMAMALILLVNPYLTNLLSGKHIFYPSMGKGRVTTLISGQTTKEFYELDRFSKLMMSVFGKTANPDPKASPPFPEIKVPFTVDSREIAAMRGVDVRWGGWGPLFGGILLISLLLLLMRGHLLSEYKVLIVVLIVLALISPESWWARLNPQLFVFSIILLMLFYRKDNRSRWLVNGLLLVALVNSGMIFRAALANVLDGDRYISGVITDVAAKSAGEVCWNIKQAHLEPIFERLNIRWRSTSSCVTKKAYCKELLGETICANGE